MKEHKKTKGFTLVELIVTLSLLAIVLMTIFSLFFYAQNNLKKSETHLTINQQLNMAFIYLEKDIHSAMKPNAATDAIRIISATQMHVYSYDDTEKEYKRIVYRLNHADKTMLERGSAIYRSDTPPSGDNPEYEVISKWETIVEGIVKEYDGKKSGFEFPPVPTPDSYGPTPTPFTRRAVQITLIVDDKNNPMNEPLVSEKLLTPRSNSY